MTATVDELATWQPGDDLPPVRIGPVTRTTLALFAGGSNDHNPIHVDVDVARAAGLEDVFAHGMLSMAYLARLVTGHFPQQQLRSLESRFMAITPVNAELTCYGRIAGVEAANLVVDLRVELEDGTVTLTGRAVISLTGARR